MYDLDSKKAWLRLTKPYMWLAICFTIVPGLYSGSNAPDFFTFLVVICGTALMAIGSFVYNQLWEKERDAVMARTKSRPLQTGQISVPNAHLFAAICLVVGIALLSGLSTLLPAILALGSFFVYVFVYTIWLKPRSTWCTLTGGLSGAVGPLIGQAAVLGYINPAGWAMFVFLLIWQPPHFWALAIRCRDQYKRAGLMVVPVKYSLQQTWLKIIIYECVLLLSIFLVCFPLNIFSFYIFGIPAIATGLIVLIMMVQLIFKKDYQNTTWVFRATIIHMLIWHTAILLEFFIW